MNVELELSFACDVYDPGAERQAFELGANDYLSRDADPQCIDTRLRAALRRSGVMAPADSDGVNP